MLSFLRKNSVKIVYGIIISFVVTTFLGVVFFNDSFKASRDAQKKQLNRQSAIAVIGDISITEQVYQLELQRLGSSLPKDTQIDENIIEIIQLNALNRAIENSILLEIGNAQNVKVKRSEINSALYSVMDQFKVTSKKELKEQILKVGGSYEAMLAQLKNDIISSKTRQALEGSVEVNENDLKYLNEKFQIKSLFISKFTTNNVAIDDEALFQKVSQVRQSILNSESFDQAILNQYPQLESAPGFNWLTMNQLNPEVARAIVTLTKNEISQPIKTLNGYYIVELNNKEQLIKNEISKEQLINDWSKITLYSYLAEVQKGHDVKILNPNLKAIKFKREGRLDDAIMAYEGAISLDPSNPYPNLYIAKLQLLKGDIPSAKQSLLKAEIKESLISDKVVVPEIHLLLAKIYDDQKFSTKRDSQYDKLINEDSTMAILTYLKETLIQSNDNYRVSKVDALIEQKQSTASIIEDKIELSDNEEDLFLTE